MSQEQADLRRPTPERLAMNYFTSWRLSDTVMAVILALVCIRINVEFGRLWAVTAIFLAAGVAMGRFKAGKGYGRGYVILWQHLAHFYIMHFKRGMLWESPGRSESERNEERAA